MKNNVDFKDFIEYLTKQEKSSRVYKILSENDNQIPNWVSYFTGSRSELTGVKGNILSLPQINKFDNIFKRMKKNHISNKIICIIYNDSSFTFNGYLSKIDRREYIK